MSMPSTFSQVSPEYRRASLELALKFYEGADAASAEELVKVASVFYEYVYGKKNAD